MWKVADLNVLPHKVEILGIGMGIGIAKDKTNKTGETEWTGVNRFINWKGDTQSRSYAKGELAANVKQQAVLAGFESQGWRQSHHLGRAAIAVDMSCCNALIPGLIDMPDNLPARFQEFHQCLTKTAVKWWQNLAITP